MKTAIVTTLLFMANWWWVFGIVFAIAGASRLFLGSTNVG